MSPDKKPKSYESALSKAWQDLATLDPKDVARKSGATYDAETVLSLNFMGMEYLINTSKNSVKNPEGKELDPFITVLLLHYLIYAKNIEAKGKLITFRELGGGDAYYGAFQRRALFPLTGVFGNNIEALRIAGQRIGASEGGYGDISLKIDVFPRIPVTVIIWEGDEEVPPSSNMLFDETIKELLPTEDVAVIGGFVASALIKNKPE